MVPVFLNFSEYTSLNNPFSIICDWEIARCTEYCMKKNVNISFPEPYSRSAPYNDVLIIAALVIDIKRFQLRHPPELEYKENRFYVIDGCHRLRALQYLRVPFVKCFVEILKVPTSISMEENAFQSVKKKVTERPSGWNLKWSTQEGDVVEELIKQYETKNAPKTDSKEVDHSEVIR